MERRYLFDQVVADYANVRPDYPQALMDDFFQISKLKNPVNVLEIGSGTGQATDLLLKNQMTVTVVEIGEKMIAHLKQRFADNPDISYHHMPFESFEAPSNSFDLIFAASSFHWVDPELGFKKAHYLLKDNGYLLLCWNSKTDQSNDSELFKEIAKVYEKIAPEMSKTNQKMFQHEKRIEDITKEGLFANPLYLTYPYERILNAEDYIRLLGTYSDHIALDSKKRESLYYSIMDLIKQNNDEILLKYEVKTYLSKKRSI